jgi:preprotein translocase subunit SecA
VGAASEPAVRRAERLVTLSQFDRAWRDHLALVADLREGIHLVGLGGQDPLTRFTADIRHAFSSLEDAIEQGIAESLSRVRVDSTGIDLKGLDIKGPSSTWTYLVNDDPFKNQIGMMLTGPGRTSIAIYSAVVLLPLFLLWGLVDRFVGRRARQRDAHQ